MDRGLANAVPSSAGLLVLCGVGTEVGNHATAEPDDEILQLPDLVLTFYFQSGQFDTRCAQSLSSA
jgi:hypothetical protein